MADRVTIQLEGLMLEKLLMHALDKNVRFGRIIRLSRRQISVSCSMHAAHILTELCEKYNIDCRIVQLRGINSLIAYMKRRSTVCTAFLVMGLMCPLFLSRIWAIDIKLLKGSNIPAGTYEALTEAGIYQTSPINRADTGKAALILNALDGCAHASVHRKGICIVAEIVCEDSAPVLYDKASTRDLVAACDGVVSSVNVKSGTAMVSPGDTVKKGQILIAGYERAGKEDFTDLSALGSVKAKIWYEGAETGYIYTEAKRFTGRVSMSESIVTPWLTKTLEQGKTFARCDESVKRIPLGGMFIPLQLEKTVRSEYELTRVENDAAVLKLTLEAASYENAVAKAAENAPENAEIIDKWTDFSMIESEDIIHARTVVELEAEIAVTRGYLEGY